MDDQPVAVLGEESLPQFAEELYTRVIILAAMLLKRLIVLPRDAINLSNALELGLWGKDRDVALQDLDILACEN